MNLKEENKIIFIYILLGALWIYFTDEILISIFENQQDILRFQTYKGLIYVLFTGFVFYVLLKKYFNNLRSIQKELERKNEKLSEYSTQLKEGNIALRRSYQNLYEQTEDLKVMIEFINNINKETFTDVEKFLSKMLRTAYKLIPRSDYGSVYQIKNDRVHYVDAIGHNLDKLKSKTYSKQAFKIHKKTPQIINYLLDKNKNDMPDDEYSSIKKASREIKQSITFSLVVEGDILAGISLDLAASSEKVFSKEGINTLKAFSNLAQSFYTLQRYNKLQGNFQRDIILSMIKFLEFHDKYTGGHSEEVAKLSKKISIQLNLTDKEINDAYWTGLVHDIGKLVVPGEILNKKDKFTKENYEYIKNHPIWAYRSLTESERLKDIAEYVLYHHERWDGKGYPEGLKGTEIPLISRIIAVADAYSAMTSNRSYRKALNEKEVIQELVENKAKQFDPRIVDEFIKIMNN